MKKLMIIAAAVAAMAACTKSEVVYDDTQDEISFAPVSYTATKAPVYGPVEGTTYPRDEEFKVFSLYTESQPGTEFSASTGTTAYFEDATFERRDNIVWGGVTPYYWPKTGSLYFTGYSPAELPQSQYTKPSASYDKTNGSKLTIPNFAQGAYAYTDGETANPQYSMVDLMYFDIKPTDKSVNNAGSNGVPVVFNHALSWLTFNFSTANKQINDLFTITKVTLKNVGTCATFTSGPTLGAMLVPEWSDPVWKKDIVLFDNSKVLAATGNVLSYYDYQTETGNKFVIDDVLVIPQAIPNYNKNASIEITYTQKAYATAPAVEQTQTFQLKGGVADSNGDGIDNTLAGEWVINRHYTYNITFSASEILIAPSVALWQDVEWSIEN